MTDTSEKGRYFFAVWPGTSVRARLQEWSASVRMDPPARQILADKLHITLVFLGELDGAQLDAVRRVAAAVDWPGGTLVLDRIGYWKRSSIVWAGSREGCESLSALAEGLREGLRRLGFRVEARPFVPHVTLYRKAQRRPKWEPRAVEWPIDEFCLVKSRLSSDGAAYEVLARWSARADVK